MAPDPLIRDSGARCVHQLEAGVVAPDAAAAAHAHAVALNGAGGGDAAAEYRAAPVAFRDLPFQ